MRRARIFIASALFLVFAANTAHGDIFDVLDQWYSDDTYSNEVGFHDKDCDGYVSDGGSQSDWWSQILTRCSTGQKSVQCWHWNGSSWEEVGCAIDANARVFIPTGQS